MKIKILTLGIITACILMMAPIVPSVEAATIETGYTAAIVAQGTAGDEQTRKEQLQHDEINNHP